MSTQNFTDDAPLDHRIVIAVTQGSYRAFAEHAWRRRISLAELGRQTFVDDGLFTMPAGSMGTEVAP